MILRTFEGLQALTTPVPSWSPSSSSNLSLYGLRQSYATIYATQPNVRTCVDFLARNIAELSLHAFRRVSDTDRIRLNDHEVIRWIGNPNPSTRRYRLMEALMGDLGIYFGAYWAKVRTLDPEGSERIGLVRLPGDQVTAQGTLIPTGYQWTTGGKVKDFAPSELVVFGGYNPLNPLTGLSPLETLRRVLAEEKAAGDHRELFWRNAGRHEGIIERPLGAPKWLDPQKRSFREQWQEYSGGGARVGMTAVLEDGMSYKQTSFSPKDAEYLSARKLTREECAAHYQIPLPLVGILEHATFSNIKEQHKHLYADCLGPWLKMIVEELTGQLLVECADTENVYLEFNIDEKLKGTPEERAASIFTSTGRAWRTVNEARGLDNLPRIDDPDLDTVAPQQGGPATAVAPSPRDPQASAVTTIVEAHRGRHRQRLAKVDRAQRATTFAVHVDRWDRELAADLKALVGVERAEQLASHWNTETRMLFELEG